MSSSQAATMGATLACDFALTQFVKTWYMRHFRTWLRGTCRALRR